MNNNSTPVYCEIKKPDNDNLTPVYCEVKKPDNNNDNNNNNTFTPIPTGWCGTPPYPCGTGTGSRPKNPLLTEIKSLASNPRAKSMATDVGLSIQLVNWEDTGRYKDSCWGPNISDMTLCVDDNNSSTTMPVIRKPNFSDVTCDVPIGKFMVKVGNEKKGSLKQISFLDYLENIKEYAQNDKIKNLVCDKDVFVLTSSQACILPLSEGKVEFNVKLHNYQSSSKDPAVLVVLVSDQGTSAQVVTDYNQSLYFNKEGMAANFLAQRLSEHRKETGSTNTGAMTNEEKDKNMIFMFQIPLKQKPKPKTRCAPMYAMSMCESAMCMPMSKSNSMGIEDAILSTTDGHSKFEGTKDLELERDDRFPIRCTIQYYKVTDTVDIPSSVFKTFAEQLNKVYDGVNDGEKGSLVVDGKTDRITEPEIKHPKPEDIVPPIFKPSNLESDNSKSSDKNWTKDF